MSSKPLRTTVGIACAACLAACGNYSNEDLDFQLALPQQGDIAANVQLSTVRINSAEYYRATRNAIVTFNAMVTDMLALVENVRRYPATTRLGNRRIWGPFPSDKYPTWQVRVVMDKSTAAPRLLHMDYWVQFRPINTDDSAWISFLTGSYDSAGSARNGSGDIHMLTVPAREASYPVDDDPGLVNLDHLDVQYKNATYPMTVKLTIVNLPKVDTRTATYDYAENEDGSGSMAFDWQGKTDTGLSIEARMYAQWIGSGVGRADLTAQLPAVSPDPTLLGTDCWGADTEASYSYRRRASPETKDTFGGDERNCIFQRF